MAPRRCTGRNSRPGAASAALVATLDAPPATSDAVCRLPKGVSWLQVRADRVGDVPASWLRDVFGGRLLYTLEGDGRAVLQTYRSDAGDIGVPADAHSVIQAPEGRK